MVVNDLDVEGIALLPAKANAPLIVDADRVLALAVALQRLEPVAGQAGKVFKRGGSVEDLELPLGPITEGV